MKHEEYKQMVALEAVGGLPADEARSLAAHLSSCAECRAELDQLRETAAALVYTVAPVEPSAALRARVLASVKGLKQSSLEEQTDAVEISEAAAVSSAWPAKDLRQMPAGYSVWQIVSAAPVLRYGAMAAAVIIVALAIGLAAAWKQTRDLRAEMERTSDSLQQAQRERAREGEEMARMRAAVELLSAPEARIALLAGTETSPQARGRLLYDRQTGRALLFVSDLPPAPAGKAYQLWYIVGSNPLPGGVFTPGATGEAMLHDHVPEGGRNASVFAVTLEPAGGAQSPTGDKFLLSAAL